MTPQEKIKQKVVFHLTQKLMETPDRIEDAYDELDEDAKQNYLSELREGEYETDIPKEYCRYYETKSMAIEALDGSWVGFTYYFGGGKHSNPEEIEWMEDAYDLNMVAKEEVVVVKYWSKIE